MAFTTKQFNDLRGILLLMLLTIPSIATTNIDCNGKPFHCVNSTHFMICVDLGSGVSSTIDSFIIPCPAPTECHGTNRFECEFPAATTELPTNEPLGITTDQTTIATVQASEPTARFVPEIITTVAIKDLYNTVSSTTSSGSEQSTPNPTFITDSTTIDVFDNANVSTSGSHADLEVEGRNIDILNITSSTQDVISETLGSSVITDSAVANTTENAIIFTQADINIDTIAEVTTVNLDIGITMTGNNKIPIFSATERVSSITENKTDINYIAEKQLVSGNINLSDSVQNQAVYTTESLRSDAQVDNNIASTTEIVLDLSIVANDQDQLTTEKANETTVTVKNPLKNVLINAENIITRSTDAPNEYTVTDAVIKQTTQSYGTTETLVASNITIPSDLSISTGSTTLVETNTLTENKVKVAQEKQPSLVDRETIEKTLRPVPKINTEMFTQNATSNNNLGNVATGSINDSDVITGPSSELYNAVIPSIAPTDDTILNTETTIIQDAFYSVTDTSVTSTREVNVTTDTAIANDNNNNIVDIISNTLPSTDFPTLTTDEKIISTESTNSETTQNEIVVLSLETNSKILPENILTPVTTENIRKFNPTVTEPVVSESTNFVSNVLDTQSSKLDPALQQLEVFNRRDKDTNVSNVNSQHNILSNIDFNTVDQNIKTETITTEPTFIETVKSTDNSDVNKRIQLAEHSFITPQRESGRSKIKTTQTTEIPNDIVSNVNVTFVPSVTLTPELLAEPFLYQEAQTSEKTTEYQVVIESTVAGDNQLNSQNNEKIDSIISLGSSILPIETTGYFNDVTESNRKTDQFYTTSETRNTIDTPNKKAVDFNIEKIISELPRTELTRHEIPTATKNDQIITQLQERIEIKTLQKTTTDIPILYSPTKAADGKLVSVKSNILENEQNIIKSTVADFTPSKNQQTVATKQSILEVNHSVTDSAVGESNLESSDNVQLPKALITETIDIIDKHNLNAPEMGSEKSNKVEPKGYETPMTPMIETQTQLKEIGFNTPQQKVTKIISSITQSIAEYHTISKIAESIRNNVDFDIPTQTVFPDSTRKIVDFDVPTQKVYPDSTRKIVDFDVPTQKVYPDSTRKNVGFDAPIQTVFPDSTRQIVNFDVPTQKVYPDSTQKNVDFDVPTQELYLDSTRKIVDFDVPTQKVYPDSTRKNVGFDAPIQTVFPDSTRKIVDFDVPTQKVYPDSTRKIVDFDVPTQTVFPDSTRKIVDFDVPTQKVYPDSTQKIVDFDVPTQKVYPDSTRKIVDYDVPTQTVFPDSTRKIIDFDVPTQKIYLDSTQKIVDFDVPTQKVYPDSTRKIVDYDVPTQTVFPDSTRKIIDFDVPTQKIYPDSTPKIVDYDVSTQKISPDSTRKIVDFDVPTQTIFPDSTLKIVDYDVPTQIVFPDSILQLTTLSVLENTENINSVSVLNSIDSTKKGMIENHSDFIKTKDDKTKYYSTNDLTKSISTISLSENLDGKVQDGSQKMASQNQIVIPIVNLLENIQYNSNIKLSDGLTSLQTPIKQMTTESEFASQHNTEKINENPQDQAPNNINTVANIANNSVPMPINSKKLSFTTENSYKADKQETSVPISEKTVINLTPSNTKVLQKIVPDEFRVVTGNTAYSKINHEVPVALSQSANNNNKDVIIGTTNNGLTQPQLSPVGDFSIQNTYIDKHIIIKQEGPHTTESVPKEINSAAVNEEEKARADLKNHTSTRYTDIIGKIIPAESAIGRESFVQLNNKTSNESSSNLVFNESTLVLVSKNRDQNFTVVNDTKFSKTETVQTRNQLEGLPIVGLDKTQPTHTSDNKILPITADKTSTPVTYINTSEKDQTSNYEAVFTATQTLKSPQINKTENTHSGIVSSKDGNQNGKKAPEARVKSLAERDVSTTSNNLSKNQVEPTSSNSQKINNNAGEAVNLALFDILSSAKSSGFEEKNNKPSSEKPDDEETTASGNEGENSKINKDSSFTTLSSESVSVTTESIEGDNNGNYNNNIIVRSTRKYETLTSKPTKEISTRPTQVDNLKNIQVPIVPEVSTQSTVRSTSQKLSLENNTPLPATTKAITNNFICKFNQRGRFADNHDCRKFYICHGRPQPLEGICPFYTVFSELRKQCTKNLSHCVRNNQFQCVSEGRFSDFLNDNIYYICVKNKLSTFIRFKLRCQNGYHLNKTSVRCELNTESSQSISSDISKSQSEQSAALKLEVKDSKSIDSSKKKFECKEEGKFANPDNCRAYYVCKKKNKSEYQRKKKKCDRDEYFHKDKKKCVDAESYECK